MHNILIGLQLESGTLVISSYRSILNRLSLIAYRLSFINIWRSGLNKSSLKIVVILA